MNMLKNVVPKMTSPMISCASQEVKKLLIHQNNTKQSAKINDTELPKIKVAKETNLSKVFSV
jgi:hypothetical protein